MLHFIGSLSRIGAVVSILLVVVLYFSPCNAASNYLTDTDRQRLQQVFKSVWPPKDLPSVHYAVLGSQLLGEAVPNEQDVCKFLLQSAQTNPTAETYFYVTLAWNSIGNCQPSLPNSKIIKTFTEIILKEVPSISDLYYAVLGLKTLNQSLTAHLPKVKKAVQAALKKDDSISNIGYSLHIASQFDANGVFAYDRIEDAVVQADEIDGKYLQFEGGLSITALLVSGALKLCEAVKESQLPLTSDQTVKFSNYFLSRRSVQSVKGAYSLLNVIGLLSSNKFQNPIVVGLEGTGAVSLDNSKISVRVCDLLGQPLPFPLTVTLESATRVSDGVVILSKKKFQPVASDKMLYTVFLLEGKTSETPGPYRLSVSAVPTSTQVPSTRFVGNVNVPLDVRIMATVVLAEPLLVGVADSDQLTQPKFHKVSMPNKLKETLEVDSLQKLAVRFSLKEKTTGKPIKVHQAFVRLLHHNTNQEVIFVTDVDVNHNYKLDLDIGAKSHELGHLSGLYKVELIVGDNYVANSFRWLIADVKLNFGVEHPAKSQTQSIFKTKPEIKHLFREPERRPPILVSNLFTGLVLLPLIILLILWFQLGINLSNFSFSLSTIGFHLGLGAIFTLFGLFWLQLNMFETLKYLLGLGVVTFLCGNKLLAKVAAQQKR
ncbi:oligosaccharide transferase delta subunit [Rhodnius prolixus]